MITPSSFNLMMALLSAERSGDPGEVSLDMHKSEICMCICLECKSECGQCSQIKKVSRKWLRDSVFWQSLVAGASSHNHGYILWWISVYLVEPRFRNFSSRESRRPAAACNSAPPETAMVSKWFNRKGLDRTSSPSSHPLGTQWRWTP